MMKDIFTPLPEKILNLHQVWVMRLIKEIDKGYIEKLW